MNNITYAYKYKEIFKSKGIDGYLIKNIHNIFYFTGYTNDTGIALILGDKFYLLTDSRFIVQARNETKDTETILVNNNNYASIIEELLITHNIKRLGIESSQFNIVEYQEYDNIFAKNKIEIINIEDSINNLRSIKTDEELELIKQSELICCNALELLLDKISIGSNEKDIACELEYIMKRNKASDLSFNTIAASGTNSSIPHAMPQDYNICDGDFLTLDFGCIYKNYCSDMTRTFAFGSISKEQTEIYRIVKEAQEFAISKIKAGVKCSDIDKFARDYITEQGYGKYFTHSLGHSVGLEVHETPTFSTKCDTILERNMVLSVEPGIYIDNKYGVRIEDLVVINEDSATNITPFTKELIIK